ncbi:MAG: hypothetical protein JWO38_1462 [Gemmataceae bacterium]|nr:hypothetical protein [Gemmataceae bacterium]
MANPVRFYLDQNVFGGTVAGLRALEIDVLSAQEAGRCGLPDPDQLAFASAEGRVIVTFDQDYSVLHAAGVPHAGSGWCHPTKYSVGQLVRALEILHGVLTAAEMVSQVEYL